MRHLHLVHHPAQAQDPGSVIPSKRLSTGQQWHKPPNPGYGNATGLGTEKSLRMGSPPHCCKAIKRLLFCSGKVDLDPRHPEGSCY